MLINVLNNSDGGVEDDEILDAVRAVNRQIDHDFRPYWNLAGELRLGGRRGHLAPVQDFAVQGEAVIYIQNDSMRSPGIPEWTAGYHDKMASGIPAAYIYVLQGDPDWTLSLSHEALELVADPLVNIFVAGPHPDRDVERGDKMVFHSYEVCDAVMDEFYFVDGKKVSNFLLPLYFTEGGHEVGRVVYKDRPKMRKPLKSFGLNPGGYIPFYDPVYRKYFHCFLRMTADGQQYETRYHEARRMAHYRLGSLDERVPGLRLDALRPGGRRSPRLPG